MGCVHSRAPVPKTWPWSLEEVCCLQFLRSPGQTLGASKEVLGRSRGGAVVRVFFELHEPDPMAKFRSEMIASWRWFSVQSCTIMYNHVQCTIYLLIFNYSYYPFYSRSRASFVNGDGLFPKTAGFLGAVWSYEVMRSPGSSPAIPFFCILSWASIGGLLGLRGEKGPINF